MKEKQGNIAKIGLPRLLYGIFNKADRFAILDIIREPVKKRFYFADGIPVAATSNILNEVLGRLLIQEGIITQKQYERSLEVVLKEKKKHGEVLISMRLITKEQLESFLALQLKRRLLKIFSWNDGTYRYMKADSVPAALTQHPLHPASLILEGISVGFYPELNMRSDLKPWLDRVVKPSIEGERFTLDDFGLNLQEKRFFEAFDGRRPLKDVLESSDLLRQRALSLALSFVVTGALKAEGAPAEAIELEETSEARVAETGADARLSAELMFIKAKGLLAEGSYKEAIETLKQITDLNPTEGEYWAYLGWAVYKNDPSRLKEAEQLIKDSIDLNNELDSAWYFLGRLFIETSELEWAVKALKTSLAKNPWMTEALYELKRLELKGRSSRASADYMEALKPLGFPGDPFEEVPDQRFMTLPASRADLLDKVLKDLRNQTEPVLITGADRSGKSALALEIIRSMSVDKALVSYIAEPPERELLLVRAINAELGVQTESLTTKELLLSLGMRVSQNRIQGGRALIIIDNADRLSTGCLKLIQYLSRIRSIQLLLLAGPGLTERLKDPEFAELDAKTISRHTLEPLDRLECDAYIERRVREGLGVSESRGFFLLEEETLKTVYERSGGIPGMINSAAIELIVSRAKEAVREEPSVDETTFFEIERPTLTAPAPEPPSVPAFERPSFEEFAGYEAQADEGEKTKVETETSFEPGPAISTEPSTGPSIERQGFEEFIEFKETEGPAKTKETETFEAVEGTVPGVSFTPGGEETSFEPFISFEPKAQETPAPEEPLTEPGSRIEKAIAEGIGTYTRPSTETQVTAPAGKEPALKTPVPVPAQQQTERSSQMDAYAPTAPRKEGETHPPKKGIKRALVWVLVMLVLGLIIGALIGVFFFGYSWPPSGLAPEVTPKQMQQAPSQALPVDLTAPVQGTAAN